MNGKTTICIVIGLCIVALIVGIAMYEAPKNSDSVNDFLNPDIVAAEQEAAKQERLAFFNITPTRGGEICP